MDRKASLPYGTWKSPITAQAIAAGSRSLSSIRMRGGSIFWLEGLAAEGGRVVLVKSDGDHARQLLTPPPFNVRSRVHEYGGGAYVVAQDAVYFSNFADNLVYAQRDGEAPRPLTHDQQLRHADFEFDGARRRLIAVQEDHTIAGREAVNRLVGLPLSGKETPAVLASGHDFYAAPRLSPDGARLAWLCWNHPQMPFNGCELWLGDFDAAGAVANARRIAGGPDESMCQPAWSPGGDLYVVSDRSGWWNIYRLEGDDLVGICPMSAEFARPHWVFAETMFGFNGANELVATYVENGLSKLLRVDTRSGERRPLDTPWTDIQDLRVGDGFAVALAASPTAPLQVVRLDLATGAHISLASSTDAVPDPAYLSFPQSISYASANGRVAHAFYYPPANADCLPPADELPPLIVTSHGGPTSMASSALRSGIQYWTSRGFGVLDVNYGGSTGYGRAYKNLLEGQWGIVDVEDCAAGAQHLAERGLVDRQRMAIRGSSASGFTTLCALTFHDVFKAGASHYGVSDLASLDVDTHKFESRYTSFLVAPAETRASVYAQRSPLLHAHRLSCPMIFFQGLEDKVAPPAQSKMMVDALKARGVPVAYVPFEGEGHGFRRAENIQRSLEAELYFYGMVFGFEPDDAIEPVEISDLRGGRP